MITTSIKQKLDRLLERFQELTHLMADPGTLSQPEKLTQFTKEFAQLEPLAQLYEQLQSLDHTEQDLTALRDSEDEALAELVQTELAALFAQRETLEKTLLLKLLPTDPHDNRNCYLEIRAGTGGDEAAIFAGDLFRMYNRYCDSRGWSLEIVHAHPGEHGGFKEIITKISGQQVYADLKFESGTHRVQRVPTTETQGRIHTSACTIAILPEVDEIHEVHIRPEDLRVDTYRSSGAGGQHVNKTDSAIRITHIPSGLVVECQDERSQHKNRARAMSLLKSRLLNAEQSKQKSEQADTRKLLVGSGDRSERIRTYNYPQGRLTDHRINLTLYQLPDIMEGQLHPVIDALKQDYQATLLAELSQQHV